jgi:ribosomal protein S21
MYSRCIFTKEREWFHSTRSRVNVKFGQISKSIHCIKSRHLVANYNLSVTYLEYKIRYRLRTCVERHTIIHAACVARVLFIMVVRRSLRIASTVTSHSLFSYSAQTPARIPLCNVLSRSLSTTAVRNAQEPQSQEFTSTQNQGTIRANDNLGQSAQSTSSTSQPLKTALSSQPNGTSREDALNTALEGFGTGRPPRKGPRTSERPQPVPARPTTAKLNFKDDLANMISTMRNQASRNVITPNDRSGRGGVDTSQMRFPQGGNDMRPYAPPFDPKNLMAGTKAGGAVIDTEPPKMRMNPSLGRTVDVDADRNMDLARAFQTLNIKCSINRVKQDFNKQRFHERPGLKRKRLATERWRKRFKESFRATVRRVQDMRRKGW